MEPIRERLEWLAGNSSGYVPQIYDQLAGAYRRSGREEDARRVAIAKQRRRRAQQSLLGKAWSLLLDVTVGFGYRTGQALLWLVALWLIAIAVFNAAYPSE